VARRTSWANRAWLRFLAFGGANTVVTFGIFIGFGLIIHPALAYTIAFIAGIAIVTVFSNRLVFRANKSWARSFAFVGWYLLVFSLGQVIISVTEPTGMKNLVYVSALLLAVTVPLSYLGGQVIFQPYPGPTWRPKKR